MIRELSCLVLALAATVLPGLAAGDDFGQAVIPLSTFPREPILIETRGARRHSFEAWRADTNASRQQGLMYVRDIQPQQAMIFVYDPPQFVSMWMKNTFLPLDMLFVDAAGCVVNVKRNASPGSLDAIRAEAPVVLVVELKGGTTKTLGIGPGDRVSRPGADWPASGQPCTRSE